MLLIFGLAVFGVAVLPKLLSNKPLAFPIVYIAAGVVLFSLPMSDPVSSADLTERLSPSWWQRPGSRRTAKPDSSVTRSVEPHRRMLVPFYKVFCLAKQTGRKSVCGCRGQWVRKTAIPKSNPGLQSVGPQHSDQPQDSQVLHPSE